MGRCRPSRSCCRVLSHHEHDALVMAETVVYFWHRGVRITVEQERFSPCPSAEDLALCLAARPLRTRQTRDDTCPRPVPALRPLPCPILSGAAGVVWAQARDQLIPVRQDQGAASTPLDEQGED